MCLELCLIRKINIRNTLTCKVLMVEIHVVYARRYSMRHV